MESMTRLLPGVAKALLAAGVELRGDPQTLALVPEAIAFALVAHVSPLTGLYAAFIVCLVTSVLGGRPGMISGAAGALAVVMTSLVVSHGAAWRMGIRFASSP